MAEPETNVYNDSNELKNSSPILIFLQTSTKIKFKR